MKNNYSRRKFIQTLSAGSMITATGVGNVLGKDESIPTYLQVPEKKFSANDRVRIAGIGMGIMGFTDVKTAIKVPGVELIAACDLYKGRLERCKEVFYKDIFTTRDYREILDRKDIDAVIVATSDHWHDRISIEALQSGKAVYCEKPMVHHIEEGLAVVDAQKKSGKPLIVGSQGVSAISTWKAHELYKAGAIGELVMVEVWHDRQSANGAWKYSIPTDASKETIDWDRFLGDAPKHEFDKERFFWWRAYKDYGCGIAGDMFVHFFSRLHAIIDSKGPERIMSMGGLHYWKDGRDTHDVIMGIYDYPASNTHPAFHVQMRANFVDGKGGGSGFKLYGTDGVMSLEGGSVRITHNKIHPEPGYGQWDSFGTFSEAQQKEFEKWYKTQYPPKKAEMQAPKEEVYTQPEWYDDHVEHFTNWCNAIRSGTKLVEDAEFGLRAAAPALATNLSAAERKVINWNPESMRLA